MPLMRCVSNTAKTSASCDLGVSPRVAFQGYASGRPRASDLNNQSRALGPGVDQAQDQGAVN